MRLGGPVDLGPLRAIRDDGDMQLIGRAHHRVHAAADESPSPRPPDAGYGIEKVREEADARRDGGEELARIDTSLDEAYEKGGQEA